LPKGIRPLGLKMALGGKRQQSSRLGAAQGDTKQY
jgi:hypothetical protein